MDEKSKRNFSACFVKKCFENYLHKRADFTVVSGKPVWYGLFEKKSNSYFPYSGDVKSNFLTLFWSSSVYVNNTDNAWNVNFNNGNVNNNNKTNSNNAICVR